MVDFGPMKLQERKHFCHTDLAEAKSHGALCQWSYIFSHGKADIGVISISWQNSQKKKEEMSEFFPDTHSQRVQRSVSPFPVEVKRPSLQQLFGSDLLSLLLSPSSFFFFFGATVRAVLLSYVRGAWTAAKPVRGSSYFDTPKHLPSLKRGGERHRENNGDRASFPATPRRGRSRAACLSLKKAWKVRAGSLPFKASGEHALMDSASFLHSLFPPRHLFSFPWKVTRRGYPRRKCLSSEGGACACCLFFFFFSSLPLHYFQTQSPVLSFLRNGLSVADNRMSEEIARTTLLLPYQFTSSPELFQFSWWQTQKEFIV